MDASSTAAAEEEEEQVETSTPIVNTPTRIEPRDAAVGKDTVIEAQQPETIHVALEKAPSEAAVDTSTSSDNKDKPKSQETPPKIESFAAAMSSGTTSDIGSRFYIKRRILVGNVSKFIAPGKVVICLDQYQSTDTLLHRTSRCCFEAIYAQMDDLRCRATAIQTACGRLYHQRSIPFASQLQAKRCCGCDRATVQADALGMGRVSHQSTAVLCGQETQQGSGPDSPLETG